MGATRKRAPPKNYLIQHYHMFSHLGALAYGMFVWFSSCSSADQNHNMTPAQAIEQHQTTLYSLRSTYSFCRPGKIIYCLFVDN